VWHEVEYGETDLETVIQDLLSGQCNNPARVVATAEFWSQDVFVDVRMSYGDAVTCRAEISRFSFQDFTDQYEGRYRDVQLPLPMRLV